MLLVQLYRGPEDGDGDSYVSPPSANVAEQKRNVHCRGRQKQFYIHKTQSEYLDQKLVGEGVDWRVMINGDVS